jgi:hypothetical protein
MLNALEIINKAEEKFGEKAGLVYQRAKIKFHNNEYEETMKLSEKALELGRLTNIEFIYCSRNLGISFAKTNDWFGFILHFENSLSKAKECGMNKYFLIGLSADIAYAHWKNGNKKKFIELIANCLEELEEIDVSTDVQIKFLNVTVKYYITIIFFKIFDKIPKNFDVPPVGMCSNQNLPEIPSDFQIFDIYISWVLLEMIEEECKTNTGIKVRNIKNNIINRPLWIELTLRKYNIKLIFKNKKNILFISNIFQYISVSQFYRLEQYKTNIWNLIDTKKTPEINWNINENIRVLKLYISIAYVHFIYNNVKFEKIFIEWQNDLNNKEVKKMELNIDLNINENLDLNINEDEIKKYIKRVLEKEYIGD